MSRSRSYRWASALFLAALLAALTAQAQGAGTSLRFHGNGVSDIDRVKIQIDEPPPDSTPGPPADIGAEDFTLEFWMKARASENTAGAQSCRFNINWI